MDVDEQERLLKFRSRKRFVSGGAGFPVQSCGEAEPPVLVVGGMPTARVLERTSP